MYTKHDIIKMYFNNFAKIFRLKPSECLDVYLFHAYEFKRKELSDKAKANLKKISEILSGVPKEE